jgi:hypothetical protein
MKSKFKKVLKKEIAARMATEMSQFEPLDAPDAPDAPTYRFLHDRNNWLFIRFEISEKGWQAFTVELARSPDGRWPAAAEVSIPVDIPERRLIRGTPASGGCRFRMGWLFPPQRDYWWELTAMESLETIMSRIENLGAGADLPGPTSIDTVKLSSLVDDSLNKIREYGIPYLTNSLGTKRE